MNTRMGVIVCGIAILAMTTFAAARPSPPATRMSVVIPSEIHVENNLPLKLSFKFSTDEDRTISTGAIAYLLLAEDGSQVAIDAFNIHNGSAEVVLKGTEPTFEPEISFNSYCTQIVPGKRYQLVCTWSTSIGTLAGSAWFTIAK